MPILLLVIVLISSFAAGNLYQDLTYKSQERQGTTQTNSSPASEPFTEIQQGVNKNTPATPNNVKGVLRTDNIEPMPTSTPLHKQNIINSPSQGTINKVFPNQFNPIYNTPIANNPTPKPSSTPIPSTAPTYTPMPTPTPISTPTPVIQEVENPRISLEIYWIKLSGVGYIPEYRYYTSVCLGDLDVVWGHFYIIDPTGQEWNTGNHDYRQKPCQNLSANGSLEGKPLGEYTFKVVFDEMGVTKSVKATVGQPLYNKP